mgnify:CR=1 FL=1
MPDFFWRAAAADGNVVTGQLSAVSEVAAIRQLRSQGLTPLAVQDAEQAARTGMAQAVQTAAPTAAGAGFRPAKVRVTKALSSPKTCWPSLQSWPSCCGPGWRWTMPCACSSR